MPISSVVAGLDAGSARSWRDRGAALVEVLLSIMLLGGVATAVLAVLSTTIVGVDRHRDLSVGNAALVDGLEFAKLQPWSTCADAASYRAPAVMIDDQLWSYSVSVASSSGAEFVGTCSDGDPLQRVTITVASGDGRTILTGDVVKRNS